ncbi:folic acid synthesis protein Fol1p [[Candida] anglica]
MFKDTVFISNLAATAITGKDAWNRPTPQPIGITVSLATDFHNASVTDNLKYSLNYAVISRNISEYMKQNEHHNFKSLANIGESISDLLYKTNAKHDNFQAKVSIKSTKSEIRANSVEYVLSRDKTGAKLIDTPDEYIVHGLRLLTIIGVFTFERLQRQIVDVDLCIKLKPEANLTIHKIIDDVVLYVESSNFKTVETLVMKIGQLILQNHGGDVMIETVDAKVTKPNAITFTDGVGVTSKMNELSFKDVKEKIDMSALSNASTLNSNEFNLPTSVEDSNFNKDSEHVAYIAFGSNEGKQVENINRAVELLESAKIKVLATSSLYISKPMYVKDQADFYNGVFKVSFSNLSPHDLLKTLKQIEYQEMNRVKEFTNGPRSIDLDILLYDDVVINSNDLNIPHISMLERSFVMQPLCELVVPDQLHPVSAEPLHNHLRELLKSKPNDQIQESADLLQIVPIPRIPDSSNPLKFDQVDHTSSTLIMGILNVTPDSFSDGGKNFGNPNETICSNALQLIESGATIIDIGGVSTRPGSVEPTEEEELERLIPVVEAIRSSSNELLSNCIISIDTYRSGVAEKCLLAGADIINDVSMGLYDDKKMFEIVSKYGCPYIMNHTRGTPQTMSKLTNYQSNTNEDIIEYATDPRREYSESNDSAVQNLTHGISRELALQMLKAFDHGVKKWQIILDPGIGFAKTLSQNLTIIRHASFFKKYGVLVNERDENNHVKHSYVSFNGISSLLGPSRKKFLGTICNEPVASDRLVSTAASIMACIEQNTDIVRVHDVAEMKKVCLTGDAIYKGKY